MHTEIESDLRGEELSSYKQGLQPTQPGHGEDFNSITHKYSFNQDYFIEILVTTEQDSEFEEIFNKIVLSSFC